MSDVKDIRQLFRDMSDEEGERFIQYFFDRCKKENRVYFDSGIQENCRELLSELLIKLRHGREADQSFIKKVCRDYIESKDAENQQSMKRKCYALSTIVHQEPADETEQDLKTRLEDERRKVEKQRKQLQQMKADFEATQREVEKQTERADLLETQVEQTENEKKELKKLVDELSVYKRKYHEVNRLQERIERYKRENEEDKQNFQTQLLQEREVAEQEKEKLVESVNQLEMQLEQFVSEKQLLTRRIEELEEYEKKYRKSRLPRILIFSRRELGREIEKLNCDFRLQATELDTLPWKAYTEIWMVGTVLSYQDKLRIKKYTDVKIKLINNLPQAIEEVISQS